jgi:ABC-2 type transport system permease protein
MSAPSNRLPDLPHDRQAAAQTAAAPTRPMQWSVRRELWENRSLYLAPLAVAAVMLFGFLISTIGLPQRRRALLRLGLAQQRAAIVVPYDTAAAIIILTAFIVGVFYCLDALHGERRDRSILFWKSLPVSDRITVLSKASVPLVVVPLLVFPIIVVTQLLMLLWTNTLLLMSDVSATTSAQLPLFQHSVMLLYGLIVLALWHAPVYGWLLMVSGWARRATFLWAVLPLLAIGTLEKLALNTTHFASLLKYRLISFMAEAFAFTPHKLVLDPLSQITPGRFLSTPGLWLGLLFAAAFLAAAMRLRRNREPI